MLGKSSKDQESEGTIRQATGLGVGGASLVSRDMRILGDCITEGRLRIEGTVTGDVTAGGLEVAPSGSVEGDVVVRKKGGSGEAIVVDGNVKGAVRGPRVEVGEKGRVDGGLVATEAVVEGHVQGGILAEQRLILEETAVVEGDVRARRLALKEGGQVNGNIRMGERATEGEPVNVDGGEKGESASGDEPSASAGKEKEEGKGRKRGPGASSGGKGEEKKEGEDVA